MADELVGATGPAARAGMTSPVAGYASTPSIGTVPLGTGAGTSRAVNEGRGYSPSLNFVALVKHQRVY